MTCPRGSFASGPVVLRDAGLFTDLYELTMAASYLREGMNRPATFSLFARTLPRGRSFLVAAGLEDVLALLESFAFSEDALRYLRSLGLFEVAFLEFLADLRFTGSVRAVPKGTLVFSDEPLLEVTAPIIEAQLVETAILNIVHLRAFPSASTLLIDTYDTRAAAGKAVTVAREMEARGERLSGVRLDSGDLVALSRDVRKILDEAGLDYVRIFASGGLDEDELCDRRRPGKKTWTGEKQVYRLHGVGGCFAGDVLGSRDDPRPGADAEPLLRTAMTGGRTAAPAPALADLRARCARQLAAPPEAVRRLQQAARYPVRYSDRLVALQRRLETETAAAGIAPYLPEQVRGGADVH